MRNWLEYIPFIMIAKLVRALPRRTALALGRRLGTLGRHLQPRLNRRARENLRHAFPEKPDAEIETILRRMFRYLGMGFIEMLRLDLAKEVTDLERDCTVIGADHLRTALADGHGCILLTGHVGFWEAGNFIFSKLGYPLGVVAKPMRNPLTDRYFLRMRETAGGYIISSRQGARRILKALQQNHFVGILLDQHIGRRHHGVSVPFFGRPAWTTPIIAEIAMKYRVPIIPAFAWWEDGDRYRVEISPPFRLEGEYSPEAVVANTALLTRIIEDAVRRDPAQWFWVHRRWRD
ncbi:MAG: lysophospholipid acyltransferase family protein [Desulfuromonadales bacterium]|nr:lysophospholipid acyltransferase family protein [Desulfuromonadales bacterium]